MKLTNKKLAAEIAKFKKRKAQLLELEKIRREVENLERSTNTIGSIDEAINIITDEVSSEFRISIYRLHSKERPNEVAIPRQVIFFLVRETMHAPFQHIAKAFDKDHGTVIYGAQSVRDRMSVDHRFNETVNGLLQRCRMRVSCRITDPNQKVMEFAERN